MCRSWTARICLALVLSVSAGAVGTVSSSARHLPSRPSGGAPGGGVTPLHLLQPGYLTVGTHPAYPPMESTDPRTHQFIGADIDLANALARAMGLKGARFISETPVKLLPSLVAHRFDVIMSATNHTPERARMVDFVDYMTASTGILVRKGSGITANTFHDLCGHSVSVQNNAVQVDELNKTNRSCTSKIRILIFPSDPQAIQALKAGRAEAYTADLPPVVYHQKQYPSLFQLAGKPISTHQNYGIALNKNEGVLKTALQNALARIRGSGQYGAILKKWGVSGQALAS
jgi:polar amino acid transport system substrate-binding protein